MAAAGENPRGWRRRESHAVGAGGLARPSGLTNAHPESDSGAEGWVVRDLRLVQGLLNRVVAHNQDDLLSRHATGG